MMYWLAVVLLCVSLCGGAPPYPFQDTSLPWDKRVDDLVGRLTLEEIVPQTEAVYGNSTPAIPRLGIKPYVWITECLHGQDHANTTAFPQAIGMAATFSNETLFKMAEAISYEVRAHWNGNRAQGNYVTFNGLSCFSPVVNIMRHPLWGRNQETYGECPFLSGTMAQSFLKGLHGDNERYLRVSAGCKHFDVHGGPENIPVSRGSFDAKVSMRDWRMTFLPQFKMCVDGGSHSLMCSYNAINGVPACANKQLLTDITRNEWGFKGYVVSDAAAVTNIIEKHHYLNNSIDTAAASIKAGVNLELGGTVFLSQLDAMKQGKLTEQEIRDNIKPLIYTRMRLGEFDPEEENPYTKINNSVIQSEDHRKLAQVVAQRSYVLLKNDGDFLPIKKKMPTVAIVGPMADNAVQMFGDYGSNMLSQFTTTPRSALSALGDKQNFAAGCSDTKCTDYNSANVSTAVTGVSMVVVCLGTGSNLEREGHDRSSLDLPGKQLDLLKDAAEKANGAPVVVVLFNAGPLDITWAKMHGSVTAILEVFFPAQSTGAALYNVMTMTGLDSVPAGRLPATWPAYLEQVPPMVNYTMAGRTYRYYEGEPLYPFGYGLSYSRFQYTSLTLQRSLRQEQVLKVSVSVKNIGPYSADEVVQVYMAWPHIVIPLPKYQMVGFRRIPIDVGETKTLDFMVSAEQMRVWLDDSVGWGYIIGKYEVFAGGQQPNQATEAPSNILNGSIEFMKEDIGHLSPQGFNKL